MLEILAINLAVVAAMMAVMWFVSLVRRDASIVDPFWGFGFVVIAWCTFWQVEEVGSRSWLMAALASAWGLRLSTYLFFRNIGEDEDRRYAAMRTHHGDRFWWVSAYLVFGLQGLIMWIVSIPVQYGIASGGALTWLDFVAISVWGVGFFFESVGDYQMARFKAKPENAGKVMDRGLWRYTRHPNYFGDFCVWWGHYLVAAAAGAWWTVFSPAIMSFFLMKVSGVTLLEQDIADRRPEYDRYKRETNAFFPGPPRSLEQQSRQRQAATALSK